MIYNRHIFCILGLIVGAIFSKAEPKFSGNGYAAITLLNAVPADYACKTEADAKADLEAAELAPTDVTVERICGESEDSPCWAAAAGALKMDCKGDCKYKLSISIQDAVTETINVKELWVRLYDGVTAITASDATGTSQSILFLVEARAFIGLCDKICLVTGDSTATKNGPYCLEGADATCADITLDGGGVAVDQTENGLNMSACVQASLAAEITTTGDGSVPADTCPKVLTHYSNKALEVEWESSDDCGLSMKLMTKDETDSLCTDGDTTEKTFAPTEAETTCGDTNTPCGALMSNMVANDEKCNCVHTITVSFPMCEDKDCDEVHETSAKFEPRNALPVDTESIRPQFKVDDRIVKQLLPDSENVVLCQIDVADPEKNGIYIIISEADAACATGYTKQEDSTALESYVTANLNEWPYDLTITDCESSGVNSTVIIIIIVAAVVVILGVFLAIMLTR